MLRAQVQQAGERAAIWRGRERIRDAADAQRGELRRGDIELDRATEGRRQLAAHAIGDHGRAPRVGAWLTWALNCSPAWALTAACVAATMAIWGAGAATGAALGWR